MVSCRAEDDAHMTAIASQVKKILIEEKLAVIIKVAIAAILCHPSNRFTAGLDVQDISEIIENLSEVCGD